VTKPVVRRAVPQDALRLAPALRSEDVAEIRACTGREPALELLQPFCNPHARVFSVYFDGAPIAMFGVSPARWVRGKVGAPWLLASEELFRFSFRLARESRRWVATLADGYELLENFAYAENSTHLRWLEWCGFRLVRREPWGVSRLPFWRFQMRIESSTAGGAVRAI